MRVTTEQVAAGQAVYTKRTLGFYDFVVLGVSNRFIWKAPTKRLEEHYDRHVSANHLDVGVGTGYFLDRCRFPSPAPRVALMDLNPETLEFASRRIARTAPRPIAGTSWSPFPSMPGDSIPWGSTTSSIASRAPSSEGRGPRPSQGPDESRRGSLRFDPAPGRRPAKLARDRLDGCLQPERHLLQPQATTSKA